MLAARRAVRLNTVATRAFSSSVVATSAHRKSLFHKLFRIPLDIGAIGTVLATTWMGASIYREANPRNQKPQTPLTAAGAEKKSIVILGSGWGAASMLKDLDTSLYNVTVVSPRSYFLFTPLLPSAPTGTIEARSIVEPIRSIAKRTPAEVTYIEADATDVDVTKNTLKIKFPGSSADAQELVKELKYDYLVVAVGAQPSTFNIPGVAEHACFLKELPDAIQVRKRFLECVEKASLYPEGSEERKRLLHFVVVGGGPTGVEFAGELKDYVDEDLTKWMPSIAKEVQVTLIEALPNVLNSFSKSLWTYAQKTFAENNIELILNTAVNKVTTTTITASTKKKDGSVEQKEIPYGMLVWAAGIRPANFTNHLISKIEAQAGARRGLLVDENLKVKGTENVYAIGDCAFTGHPPTGQVAHQEGHYLASTFAKMAAIDDLQSELARASNSDERAKVQARLDAALANVKPFKYNHLGSLSYVGGEKAVADLVWGSFSSTSTGGAFTYLIWRSSYIAMCISARMRALVAADWLKVSLFGRDLTNE
ncbi:hypothetical protein KL905_002386 [Ogataea polymorpha]|uniref:NADH:ubiquinone reductase (non-electrogenic) n=1 Tax=Ogataea polymorpha TaxID=460523 RepID=A0A1B7SPX5_9ASCO|nr:uncharacterized protein OGAPODRAFT_15258 [Ogataea polymorpha]KAG7880412.1 hypothetical protein KL937_001974 [Ogataea polymorpha]KAG7889208.1 hypothetical protein KL936_002782 [Ogataea polymorpha]KAG7894756.1 hypothetical protein KL908_002128 [Ogataea polymorpha]KAG7899650.1 hypothetical protein KL935_003191 [Ogataea polymorpha]KAG7906490.1 hypothetical protein KL907_002130 [Ogataea polymorpha]